MKFFPLLKPYLFLSGILSIFLISCQKETSPSSEAASAPQALSKSNVSGFAENDMVLYWNDKTAIALNPGFTQPARTRVFARVQVAVHDALNSIKPKYQRYAYQGREQHAHPDAAVASAAYWMLKNTTLSGNPPLDQW